MRTDEISAAVLAGGYSSRMGRDKALLELNGKTLLELQTERLRKLGIRDIMISGAKHRLSGTRNIPDVFPHRGPVSGIHACMKNAEKPSLLVISVDVPLIPSEALEGLIRAHTGGITALEHGGRIEPLIAVYDCSLAEAAERILHGERRAVSELFNAAPLRRWVCPFDGELLSGCNTPEEYARILRCQKKY